MKKLSIILLSVFLLLAIYLPGITGSLYYDDYVNLEGLARVVDFESFRHFVLNGIAGPTGRPIALLTFALQADSWPLQSENFLLVNIIIHSINYLLLLLLAYQVLRLRAFPIDKAFYCALGGAFMWAVLPINVSTSLVTVQRMTGLSTMFGLLALNAFTAGYFLVKHSEKRAFTVQVVGLSLGTLLAIFTKESGALIPVFALVLNAFLLKGFVESERLYKLNNFGLGLVLVGLLIYISPIYQSLGDVKLYRNFSGYERLITQPGILWTYLKLAFIPVPSQFSPFHDNLTALSDISQAVPAMLAWLAVAAIALLLKRISIWPLFALCWFITGHLLESSTISLELYFEHRNYLALFGICLALSVALGEARDKLQFPLRVFYLIYTVILVLSCYGTTSLWGNPRLAAEVWQESNPTSSRAAVFFTTTQFGLRGENAHDINIDIVNLASRSRIVARLDRSIKQCPECLDIGLQALVLACNARTAADVEVRFKTLADYAIDGNGSHTLIDGLYPLIDLVKKGECRDLNLSDIRLLIDNLLRNKLFSAQVYMTKLYFISAMLEYEMANMDKAWTELLKAEKVGRSALPVLQFQVHLAIEMGKPDEALAAIERRKQVVGENEITEQALQDLLVIAQNAEASNKEK